MEPALVLVFQAIREIRTKDVVPSVCSARIVHLTKRVYGINARTHVLVFVAYTPLVPSSVMCQTVSVSLVT